MDDDGRHEVHHCDGAHEEEGDEEQDKDRIAHLAFNSSLDDA